MRRPSALLALLSFALVLLAAAPAWAWPPDVQSAKDYAATRSGEVSFTVIGPKGNAFGWRGDRSVPLASTVKVMFLVAYLRMPSVRDRDLTARDRELLGPMIRFSDNLAATRVSEIVGASRLYALARLAGMSHFHFVTHPWGLSSDTSGEEARFMFHLDRFIPPRHDAYARYLLAHVTPSQRWGIGRLHHDKWRLYFKGGWGSGTGAVEHQIAFMERGDLRIAAAVMITNSPSHDYAKETLEGVFRRLLLDLPKPT
ncbi:MAG TPA: serine hydrolase [Actinomycetota bacterium]|nr:serine hydrolase [Actinomycetota bacterium]